MQKIEPLDRTHEPKLRARVDGKAKPLGSLGRIEDLAVQLGAIWYPVEAKADRAVLFVFAGDHGLNEEGVSSFPSAITAVMVDTFLTGRACVNAFAAGVGVEVRVVDAGVAAQLPDRPELIAAKIRAGTRNSAREPALTQQETKAALEKGASLVTDAVASGADVIAIGEMGIGNTASAALLMHRLAPAPLEQCIGAGAGHDEAGILRKREAIGRAASRTTVTAPLDVLTEFGGLEIVMMAGAVLGAAANRRPVIIDGFIASAAALAAVRLEPAARDYCIFAHCSAEAGHQRLLQSVQAEPLLNLGMRLGEGTGAVLAVPLVRAAANLLSKVADLSEIIAKASAAQP